MNIITEVDGIESPLNGFTKVNVVTVDEIESPVNGFTEVDGIASEYNHGR